MIDYKCNLQGTRFGQLIVIKELDKETCYRRWLCKCTCGKEIISNSYRLLRGLSKSCGLNGCSAKNIINLEGKKFGNLLVKKRVYKTNSLMKERVWLCSCDCGGSREVRTYKLLNNVITHCGCLYNPLKYKDRTIPVKNSIFFLYKRNASKKKLLFSLTFDDFVILCQSNCFYCGSPPSNKRVLNKKYKTPSEWIYNGIDRVDNKEGYTKTNSVPCCFMCNSAKGNLTSQEFITWGLKLWENIKVYEQQI